MNDIHEEKTKRNLFTLQNFHLPTDAERVQNLTAAFTDALELVKAVVDTTAWNDTRTLDLYFPPEARDAVAGVFRNMVSFRDQVVIDNKDVVDAKDDGRRDICVAEPVAAYTLNPPSVPDHPRIHSVCGDERVSDSHINLFNTHIRDITYGPLNVRNLRKDASRAKDAVLNADSYMWFALVRILLSFGVSNTREKAKSLVLMLFGGVQETYWMGRCGKNLAAPTSN
ncbi:MAG: hypothetical protein Q9225_000145 [Loekoesia sp. 1 TL-2023]